MSNQAGYIPISRKMFEHEFWTEKRAFSKFEAWLDLLHSARYEASTKTEFINGKPISWGRGQLVGSVRFLMGRWQWKSITKVENYLNYLQKKDMVSVEKGQGISIITICKYDTYNPVKDSERTVKGQQKDAKRTEGGRGEDETNKGNKENKEITDMPDAQSVALAEFEKFWEIYGKKTGKSKAFAVWGKIKPADKEKIFTHLPEYVKSTPEVQYRKDPVTYLNGGHWNDQIIYKSYPPGVGPLMTASSTIKLTHAERLRKLDEKYR